MNTCWKTISKQYMVLFTYTLLNHERIYAISYRSTVLEFWLVSTCVLVTQQKLFVSIQNVNKPVVTKTTFTSTSNFNSKSISYRVWYSLQCMYIYCLKFSWKKNPKCHSILLIAQTDNILRTCGFWRSTCLLRKCIDDKSLSNDLNMHIIP